MLATAIGTWSVAREGNDDCGDSARSLEGVWDADVRDEIGEAFRSSGVAYGADTWAHTYGLLDAYADEWTAAQRETCEGARAGDRKSEELLALRAVCLERRRASLAALVDVFAEPDADVIRQAPTAAAYLDGIASCGDVEALRAVGSVPRESASEAAAIDELLARADVRLATGQLDAGREVARHALERAEALAWPSILARAHATMAMVGRLSEDWELAMESQQASLSAAIVARDDRLAAAQAREMLHVEGYRLHAPGHERWDAMAEAWVERAGSHPEDRIPLLTTRGLIARDQAHFERAAQHFEEALQLVQQTGEPAFPLRAMLAETYRRMGDLPAARALYDENLRATENTVGATHPAMAEELDDMGSVLAQMDRLDEALVHFERALEIRSDAFGEQSEEAGQTLAHIATVLARQARHEDAHEYGLRAREALRGCEDPEVEVAVIARLATIDADLGNTEAALKGFREAIEVGDARLPPGHPATIGYRYDLASLEHALENYETALALANATLEQMRSVETEDALDEARLHSLRGTIYVEQGHYERAEPEFRLALDKLEGLEFPEAPDRFEPLKGAGVVALELGRPKEALEFLLPAVQAFAPPHPEHELGEVHLQIARAYIAQGKRDPARQAALQAERLVSPDRKDLRRQLAAILAKAPLPRQATK